MSLFESLTFILSTTSKKLKKKITKNGGTLTNRLGAKVNYFIITEKQISKKLEKRIKIAEKYKSLKIVQQEWLQDSLKKNKICSSSKYALSLKKEKEKEKENNQEEGDQEEEKEEKTRKRKKDQKEPVGKKRRKNAKKKQETKPKEKEKTTKKKKVGGSRVPMVSKLWKFDAENTVFSKDNIYFNSIMTKVDRRENHHFYHLQLINTIKKKEVWYAIHSHWGRMNSPGQGDNLMYETEKEGIREFKKRFRQRTGNSWDKIDNFEKKPNKYVITDFVNMDELF
ncbi:DNA ligase [Anaeramoeba flamelloides]|uniref:NAD(+) ADP-ribosyltransferase n=1 Tax=Anaeramoeba flamelloides TaxID=1746091 RepID=A0ABQ8Y921_9EUKA|nr:DNA ligase [Anaeramoeba flamelloides]